MVVLVVALFVSTEQFQILDNLFGRQAKRGGLKEVKVEAQIQKKIGGEEKPKIRRNEEILKPRLLKETALGLYNSILNLIGLIPF